MWGGCRLSGGKSPKQTRFIPSRTELVQQILLGFLLCHRHPYACILSSWSASISYRPLQSNPLSKTGLWPRRKQGLCLSFVLRNTLRTIQFGSLANLRSPLSFIAQLPTWFWFVLLYRSDRARYPLISSFSEIIPLYTYEVFNDKRSNEESKFRMQTNGCLSWSSELSPANIFGDLNTSLLCTGYVHSALFIRSIVGDACYVRNCLWFAAPFPFPRPRLARALRRIANHALVVWRSRPLSPPGNVTSRRYFVCVSSCATAPALFMATSKPSEPQPFNTPTCYCS